MLAAELVCTLMADTSERYASCGHELLVTCTHAISLHMPQLAQGNWWGMAIRASVLGTHWAQPESLAR